MNTTRIDPEFKTLIPSLTPEEREHLEESLVAEGCRDDLVVWEQENILLDGHHRFEICTQNNIQFNTQKIPFSNRNDAKLWILKNQQGRRNLTPEQQSYIRGVAYKLQKMQGARTDLTTSGNNCQKSTAEKIGNAHGVSGKTVRNDADFAESVDALADECGEEIKTKILSPDSSLTRRDVKSLATLLTEDKATAKNAVELLVHGN